MNAERWRQIEQVYYSAVASPMSSRADILDVLCPDDAEIRREVESLLDAREQAGTFLSSLDLKGQIIDLLSEPDLAGKTLGHYSILSAIGAGAMGEVYLAVDTRLDRRVALKILPTQFTRQNERVARFRREAKAASALNHPNIITIYDVGQVGQTWFIATEFVDGVTLRARLAAGRLQLDEALGIAIQCAEALEAAHCAGIVHRDIKPENVMLRPDGMVKVVDFGLARFAESHELAVDTTQAGILIGTPRYMSPEQARGQKLDARTDVFSLGALLYEMVTGAAAFPGANTAEVFAALLASTPIPASKRIDSLPAQFDHVILKALQKEPAARYQSMQALTADLQNLKQRLQAHSPGTRQKRSRSQPAFSVLDLLVLRWKLLVACLVALTGVIALAWFARPSQAPSRPEAASLHVVPLTSFEGYKDFGSFSPDGSRTVFSWNGGQGGSGGNPQRDIYTKTIGQDDPTRLTTAVEDERLPVWSPDGQSIAFCRAHTAEPAETHYAIYVIPARGGQEQKVAEGGLGVSWSSDSETLAVSGSPGDSEGIVLQSIKTGKRHQLTNPHPYFDNLPTFSPDGRWVAFTRDFGYSAREIFVVSANGGTPRQLTFDHEPTYGAAWTAGGSEIVFASNRGVGGESLWRIPARGGSPTRLSPTLEGGFYPSISRRGNRLLYTESFKDTNIYSFTGGGFVGASETSQPTEEVPRSTIPPLLRRAVPRPFAQSTTLIVSSRRDDSPSISPDGTRIAFISKRTGNEEIWTSDRTGGHLTKITNFRGPAAGTPRWSPDGRSLVFDSLAGGNPDIYLIDSHGGKPRRLTTGPSGNFMPSWSPDGKLIYFKSNRSGSDQIWKLSINGGAATQLTRAGASEAFSAPDGKLVYYTKRVWGPIWMVPSAGGAEKPVPELQSFDKIFRSWGVVNGGIYFMSRQDTPQQIIRFFDFANRQVTSLATLEREPVWDYPDLALSHDGRQLLSACFNHEVDDLMLIENFR